MRPWMAGALGLGAMLVLLASFAAFSVGCGETADCFGLYPPR